MKNVGILKFALVALIATPQFCFGMVANPVAPLHGNQSRAVDCPVCFETGVPAQLHGNHEVCVACLGDQIQAAHRNRNAGDKNRLLKCPVQNCQHDITLAQIQRILPSHVALFQQIQQAQEEKLKPMEPTIEEDRSSLRWKFAHTKPCPNCKTAIEKNSGCKWVNCTRCQREFCYTCLTPTPPNAGSHFIHNPCIENKDPWRAEKIRLGMDNTQSLVIGGIVVCAVVWGISELYEYFKARKAKKAAVRKQPVRSGAPQRKAATAGAR